jgi:hypothetical protein
LAGGLSHFTPTYIMIVLMAAALAGFVLILVASPSPGIPVNSS